MVEILQMEQVFLYHPNDNLVDSLFIGKGLKGRVTTQYKFQAQVQEKTNQQPMTMQWHQ